jgi:hypothetical protein
MVIFTALAKLYSTECFCNTKVARLGKILVQQNFFTYTVYTCRSTCTCFEMIWKRSKLVACWIERWSRGSIGNVETISV